MFRIGSYSRSTVITIILTAITTASFCLTIAASGAWEYLTIFGLAFFAVSAVRVVFANLKDKEFNRIKYELERLKKQSRIGSQTK